MCFAQGVVYTLLLCGWRHWNRETQFSGQSVGARLRRWWWGVNNWTLPTDKKGGLRNKNLAKNVTEVSAAFLKVWIPGIGIAGNSADTYLVLRGSILECWRRLATLAVMRHVRLNTHEPVGMTRL
jgi:hypothetical protein